MSVVHSYFGFSGRINRAKFWMLSILLFVFSIVAWIVAFLAAFLILGLNLTDGALPGLDEPGKLVQLILDYAIAFIVLFGVMIANRREAAARSRPERVVDRCVLHRTVGPWQRRQRR